MAIDDRTKAAAQKQRNEWAAAITAKTAEKAKHNAANSKINSGLPICSHRVARSSREKKYHNTTIEANAAKSQLRARLISLPRTKKVSDVAINMANRQTTVSIQKNGVMRSLVPYCTPV